MCLQDLSLTILRWLVDETLTLVALDGYDFCLGKMFMPFWMVYNDGLAATQMLPPYHRLFHDFNSKRRLTMKHIEAAYVKGLTMKMVQLLENSERRAYESWDWPDAEITPNFALA